MKQSHFFFNLGPYAVKFIEGHNRRIFVPALNKTFPRLALATAEIRAFVNMVTQSAFGASDAIVTEASPADGNFEAFGRDMTGLVSRYGLVSR